MSLLISKCVKASGSPVAEDGSTSCPALIVNLLITPLSLPVSADISASQRFRVSPLSAEKITRLGSGNQQLGLGTVAYGVEARSTNPRASNPARINASYAPVFTGYPPFMGTAHQSMAELSYAFCEVYPTIRRCLPSGDQIGYRAAVKFVPTCRGCPPLTEITQAVPLRGTAFATFSSPIQ